VFRQLDDLMSMTLCSVCLGIDQPSFTTSAKRIIGPAAILARCRHGGFTVNQYRKITKD